MKLITINTGIRAAALIIAAIFFLDGTACHAFFKNDNERASDTSHIFSAGYINAANQYTQSIVNQQSGKKTLWQNMVEYVQRKMSRDIDKITTDKPIPELQKRISTELQNKTQIEWSFGATGLSASNNYSVEIGSGTGQERDGTGKLIAESINGVRHVYVGYADAGTQSISEAMALANSGDIVLVNAQANSYGDIVLKDGIKLYAATSQSGTQAIISTLTVSNTTSPTEVLGFKITGKISISEASNLTMVNNSILGVDLYNAVVIRKNSKVLLKNNVILNPAIGTFGGGIDIADSGAEAVLSGNTIMCDINAYNHAQVLLYGNKFYGSAEMTFTDTIVNSTGNNFEDIDGIYVKGTATFDSSKDYFNASNVGPAKSFYTCGGLIASDSTDYEAHYGVHSYGGTVVLNDLLDTPNSVSMTKYTVNATTINAFSINNTLPDGLYGNYSGPAMADFGKNGAGFLVYDGKNMEALTEAESEMIKGYIMSNQVLTDGREIRLSQEEIDTAMVRLLGIINNPNEDQRAIMDTINGLLNDILKVEEETGGEAGLKSDTDKLLQAVGAIIMAHDMPNLLNDEAINNLKGIFDEIKNEKYRILLGYEVATAPYYEEIKNMLIKNAADIDLDSILNQGMMKKELTRLSHKDISQIIEKLKKLGKRNFKEERILQQEMRLRKIYIDPNNDMVKMEMRHLLEKTTGRITSSLAAK